MKITRRDLGVIMILVGILVVFIAYKTNFEPTQAEIEAIQEEQNKLSQEIEDLKPYVDNAPKYEKEMKEMSAKIDEIIKMYPADIWTEDNILYVVELLDELNVKIDAFSQRPATVVQTVAGEGALKNKVFSLASAGVDFGYRVKSYDDMKEMINYIYEDEVRTNKINSISLNFDKNTGEVSGAVQISEFVMDDGSKEYKEVELDDDNLGIESGCIFGETEEAKEE